MERKYPEFSVNNPVITATTTTKTNGKTWLNTNLSFLTLPGDRDYIKVDIIPYVYTGADGRTYLNDRYQYYNHRNIGSNNEAVCCPRRTAGRPCPICEYLRTPEAQAAEKWREIGAKPRLLFAVRWVDAPTAEERNKIQIFDTTPFGFGDKLDQLIASRDKTDPVEATYGRYADPVSGWTLKLELSDGNIGNNRTYRQVSRISFKQRAESYDESIVESVPDLTKVPILLGYDELKAKFHNMEQAADQGQGATPYVQVQPYTPVAQRTQADVTYGGTAPVSTQASATFAGFSQQVATSVDVTGGYSPIIDTNNVPF